MNSLSVADLHATLRRTHKRKQTREEDKLQVTLVEHIAHRKVAGVLFWHTPNGAQLGGNRFAQMAKLKKMGWLNGVSDLLFFHAGRFFALELKWGGNTATEDQSEYMGNVNEQGGYSCCVNTLDRALAVLVVWGLIKPEAA